MSTPFKVWSRFSVTKETGTFKFRAVEPPPERYDDVLELIINNFTSEEPMNKASGITENEEAVEEFKVIFKEALKKQSFHVIICCVDDDTDEIGEIIGSSITTLTKKDESSDLNAPQTKEIQKLLEMVYDMKYMYDFMKELKVDQFYDGRGVVVNPKYRGYGIAQEFFRIRRLMCKEQGVPLTAAVMTAYGTQKAAERDGWETVFEIDIKEFGKKHGVVYKNCPPITKLMVGRAL